MKDPEKKRRITYEVLIKPGVIACLTPGECQRLYRRLQKFVGTPKRLTRMKKHTSTADIRRAFYRGTCLMCLGTHVIVPIESLTEQPCPACNPGKKRAVRKTRAT